MAIVPRLLAPWIILPTHWLTFTGYLLLGVVAWIVRHQRDQLWVYWSAVLAVVIRFYLSIDPPLFQLLFSRRHYSFLLQRVEPFAVLLVALACITVLFFQRLRHDNAA